MPGQAINTNRKPYLKVIGGNLMQPAAAGDAGAVNREYELPNGSKGNKWEIPFMNWEGVIQGITLKEGDFGETCNIELDDAFIQLNTAGRYFTDFACKIFNADLTKPILFHPYDMEIDGKKKTGVSLQQGGQKLKNFFYDGTSNINGFPAVDPVRSAKKTYWKIYFAEVSEFLVEQLKTLKFEAKSELLKEAESVFAPEELKEAELNDLPF